MTICNLKLHKRDQVGSFISFQHLGKLLLVCLLLFLMTRFNKGSDTDNYLKWETSTLYLENNLNSPLIFIFKSAILLHLSLVPRAALAEHYQTLNSGGMVQLLITVK